MIKNIALSIILTCLSLIVYSQQSSSFKFGVKGGVNSSSLKMNSPLIKDENKMGYYAGLWARAGGKGTYLQTELYLSGKNMKLVSPSTHVNDVKFTSLDWPILIGTKIGGDNFGLRVNTGPVLTFFLDKAQKFEDAAPVIFRGKFKDKAIAWQFGLGIDIGNLSIDGRYEAGLSQIAESPATKSTSYPPTRLNLYTIGIGFAIF